jgi:hypothetical protein
VWDVSDLDAPFMRVVFEGSTISIDRNLYVRVLYAFESKSRNSSGARASTPARAENLRRARASVLGRLTSIGESVEFQMLTRE